MESTLSKEQKAPAQCPYTKIKNTLKFWGKGREEEVQTTLKTDDTEKGMKMEMEKFEKLKENTQSSGCPYPKADKSKETKENDSDEEQKDEGGCPMMNKKKKDPENKHFVSTYEIPRFGPFDFMFHMRGLLEVDEWVEKSKKMRSFPRHMKNTLFFQNQEKLKKVHEKEFPMVFFMYDDIKEKGNRLIKRKKYREAIEHYTYAYGLMKWIQFKDPKRQEEFLKKPSMDPILDEDIEEKHVYLDDVRVEEDSYKACVVYLLMNLSYAYMELRHYTDALECLNECIDIAEDKVADLFFRRSQARAYNKYSTQEEYDLAMADIEKAISIKDDPLFKEHKEKIIKIIEQKECLQLENTQSNILFINSFRINC